MRKNFIENEQAIDTIPLKLIVYLTLIGMILLLAAIGLKNAVPAMDTSIMEQQITRIKPSIEQMQSGYARDLGDPNAPTGNIRSIEVTLPDSLEYLSFGVDPDPDNNGILTDTPPGLVTDNGNVIYYKLTGTGKNIIKLDDRVRLREGVVNDNRWMPNIVDGFHQALVVDGSSQTLTFELVSDRDMIYTLIHLTDEMDAYISHDLSEFLQH